MANYKAVFASSARGEGKLKSYERGGGKADTQLARTRGLSTNKLKKGNRILWYSGKQFQPKTEEGKGETPISFASK